MAGALTVMQGAVPTTVQAAVQQEFVTLRLGKQLFGISVMAVQDVMRRQRLDPIPLAPRVIAGALNVRGRIVTAFDMRQRLDLVGCEDPDAMMLVVVNFHQELFALMVDSVGDVMTLAMDYFEKVPSNIDDRWREVAAGVFKLDNELLVILDVASIIAPHTEGAA